MKFFLSRFLFASAALFTVSVNSFSVEQPSISRRSLLAEGASVAATIWTIAAPTAMAAVEDLSMPIADEQKKMEQVRGIVIGTTAHDLEGTRRKPPPL
jgi:hypothetical protein